MLSEKKEIVLSVKLNKMKFEDDLFHSMVFKTLEIQMDYPNFKGNIFRNYWFFLQK